MIAAVVVVAVFAVLLLAISYALYDFTFYYPPKKHVKPREIPDSKLYISCKDKMLALIDEMEAAGPEEVMLVSKEGYKLFGSLYYKYPGAPLFIFFHGYHGTSFWDGYGCFRLCRDNRFNLLMVDERCHGRSGGRTVTFGIRERYDCKLWAEYAAARFGSGTDIILSGVSMGAASVVMACGLGLPANVKAVISDCGYCAPSEIIKSFAKNLSFPVAPAYLLVKLGAFLFGHFNLEEADSVQVLKNIHIPVLFIHGSEDSVVPIAMCEELYSACTSEKRKVVISGAEHSVSAIVDFDTYEKAVLEFVEACLMD